MKTQALTQSNPKSGSRSRRYPWRKWFSRREFALAAGRDYDCRSWVMAQQVRNRARLLGLRVSVLLHAHDAGMTVTVRD